MFMQDEDQTMAPPADEPMPAEEESTEEPATDDETMAPEEAN